MDLVFAKGDDDEENRLDDILVVNAVLCVAVIRISRPSRGMCLA